MGKEERPGHIDPIGLEDAEPAIESIEFLGIEFPFSTGSSQRAQDPLNEVLPDDIYSSSDSETQSLSD